MRADRPPSGKAEKSRAESGKHSGGRGLRLRSVVEDPFHPVQVALESRNRTRIRATEQVLHERRVRDAEAKDEASLRLLGERALCHSRGEGLAQEDVRDAGRDVEALS